ncbi:PREDICTED: uncharacterized protein LOC106807376 [Priapulus caudatus]|uniref:Uncharacterized protein LOC106807376 n=1 Tax=Priapulus caudatus TaxID=37621 RepID=A0ABM1DZ07_PRICU|nr:PREDICTED: uncharacterized protein LOC106807376 [Priapulus caudatus]
MIHISAMWTCFITIIICQLTCHVLAFDWTETHGVVPDVIYEPCMSDLQITYQDKAVEMGNEFTPTEVAMEPTVLSWPTTSDGVYTLIMTDPDALAREFIHWIVGNIRANDVNQGEVLAEYVGSSPRKDTGLHRYTFIVYKQRGIVNFGDWVKVNATSSPAELSPRINFSTRKFVEDFQLVECPLSCNMFQAQSEENMDSPKNVDKEKTFGNNVDQEKGPLNEPINQYNASTDQDKNKKATSSTKNGYQWMAMIDKRRDQQFDLYDENGIPKDVPFDMSENGNGTSIDMWQSKNGTSIDMWQSENETAIDMDVSENDTFTDMGMNVKGNSTYVDKNWGSASTYMEENGNSNSTYMEANWNSNSTYMDAKWKGTSSNIEENGDFNVSMARMRLFPPRTPVELEDELTPINRTILVDSEEKY